MIKSIKIETKNGKKVKLTLDEARELHEQLDELFGKENVTTVYNYPYYTQPWYRNYQFMNSAGNNITYNANAVSSGYATLSNTTDMKISYSAEE